MSAPQAADSEQTARVSGAKLALRLGVSRATVSRLALAGVLERDGAGRYDPAAASAAYARHAKRLAQRKAPGRALLEARARKEGYLARLRQLDVREREQALADVGLLNDWLYTMRRAERDDWLRAPREWACQLAAHFPGLEDVRKVQAVLHAGVEDVLRVKHRPTWTAFCAERGVDQRGELVEHQAEGEEDGEDDAAR